MKKIKIILILMLILVLFLCVNVNAATGTFKVSKTTVTLKEGKTTTFNIITTNCEGQFTIISADPSIVKVSSSSEWVEDTEAITLTALKEGTAKITVKANDVADTDEEEVTGSKTISVTVKANETTTDKDTSSGNKDTNTTDKDVTTTEKPKEKSNNAYLSTLGVTPKEYDFSGFNKTKTTYSVTVPSDVDSLKVLYKTADSNAKVCVSGNSGFEVGSDNKITIKVTAEDGKTAKTYTIKVTQLAEEEEKPGNVIEDEDGIYLTSLSIEGLELSPEFAKDTYSYTATLSDSSLTEVKVVAKANNENAKINISGNTNLVEGENTINIILTMEDSTVQTVYQIVVTKEVDEIPVITNPEGNETKEETDLIGKIKKYAGIAIGVIVLIVVAVIVLIVLLIRENKKTIEENDEDEEIEDTKSEEYNVYKNDENEFVNNDMQKDNFIESLYNQRKGNLDNEDLTENEKETLEEITKQTEKIFEEKVEGQSVEYSSNDTLETRKRRGKGKHSL